MHVKNSVHPNWAPVSKKASIFRKKYQFIKVLSKKCYLPTFLVSIYNARQKKQKYFSQKGTHFFKFFVQIHFSPCMYVSQIQIGITFRSKFSPLDEEIFCKRSFVHIQKQIRSARIPGVTELGCKFKIKCAEKVIRHPISGPDPLNYQIIE